MIDRLEVVNFRAFRTESFNFSRLNIFVGRNNSGKSSALSALNILAQTTNNTQLDSGPLILNGEFDQLGTFKDMVHGGRANTPVRISFSIRDVQCQFEVKYRTQRREMEISKYRLSRNGNSVFEYAATKDRYDVHINGVNIDELGDHIKKKRPKFDGFLPVFSDIMIALRRARDADRTFHESKYNFFRDVDRNLFHFRRLMIESFGSFESLGPFRDIPKRTYLYSGETAANVGRTGENAVTMIASDNSKRGSERVGFVDEITKWMRATEISGGVRVKNLTDRHFEVVVIGNDGTEHNICDVGFGCSQVLPVLVAGIGHALLRRSRTAPILIIQEPEIHLHPNAQAALGSFFANLVSYRGQVFIETHSDNLVLRVARHVALGDLSPDQVKIFYVEDAAGGRKVHEVGIDKTGSFNPDWPGGFFPQRQHESFEVARAAIRENKNRTGEQLEFRYPSK
ncbi:AAA family ATPase [Paralimibaculum aggregatum]|uniref:AAA family ATPase n=1 Tax=Paralimibaculum aggregatum TaxID=3036245 RepID=UPI002554B523|nr:DUF3696 domain-containing protein [Limibaculum sp. NKW23]